MPVTAISPRRATRVAIASTAVFAACLFATGGAARADNPVVPGSSWIGFHDALTTAPTLHFQAGDGLANNVRVTYGNPTNLARGYIVSDTSPLQAGPGCEYMSQDRLKVFCTVAKSVELFFDLGDGDDKLEIAEPSAGEEAVPKGPGGLMLTATGGPGNDAIYARDGLDTIDGGPGNDLIATRDGSDNVIGGTGSDTVDSGAASDQVHVRDGEPDRVFCTAGRDTVDADAIDSNEGGVCTDFRQPPAAATAIPVVTRSTATLQALVTPNRLQTTWSIEWGQEGSEKVTEPASAGAGSEQQVFQIVLPNLPAGTAYRYRVLATNSEGTATSEWQSFSTLDPAGAATLDASDVTEVAATLNGAVNPNGAATSWFFEYWAEGGEPASTPVTEAGAGTDAIAVSAPLAELQPGTVYHYRLVARDAEGDTAGEEMTFTTAVPAAEPTPPAEPGEAPPIVIPAAGEGDEQHGGGQAVLGDRAKPKSFSSYCRGLSKKGGTRSAFSRCKKAMARIDAGKASPGRACHGAGLSKKRRGKGRSDFARCLASGRRLSAEKRA